MRKEDPEMTEQFGLWGKMLGHSYSPQIHGELYAHPYQCYEVCS